MAGPTKRYQIQIIKAGIGDPLITFTFQFVPAEGYDDPNEYPIEGMHFFVELNYFDLEGKKITPSHTVGYGTMANFGTTNPYLLTYPFDEPSDWDPNQPITLIIQASKSDCEILFQDPNHPGELTSMFTVNLTDHGVPVPYGALMTRYTYCPGGDCFTLGNPGQ